MALIRIPDDNDVRVTNLESRVSILEERTNLVIERSKETRRLIVNALITLGTVIVSYVVGTIMRIYF